jgi:ketosteroid isomerase-like protein
VLLKDGWSGRDGTGGGGGQLLVLASWFSAVVTMAMGKPTPSLAAETEALREAYAALNRNDIPATVEACDPQIEWTEPLGGTYHGHAEVQAHLSKARDTWAEGSCEPERFIVAGDKIIVFLHVHVRPQHNMEWIDGDIADVYTFRNGKAIQMRHFPDRQQALEWAGVTASDAD